LKTRNIKNGDISNSFLLTIYTIQDTLKECDLDKLAHDIGLIANNRDEKDK